MRKTKSVFEYASIYILFPGLRNAVKKKKQSKATNKSKIGGYFA